MLCPENIQVYLIQGEFGIWLLDFGFWNLLLSSFHIFIQLLRLEMRDQGIDHGLKPAVHDAIQLMQCKSDAVVGEAILGKIVSADLLAAVARPHL
jgi:hypothetical protein